MSARAGLLLVFLATGAQADCAAARFALDGGLAYHSRADLTWMRCGVGLRWEQDGCVGATRRLGLEEARVAAREAGERWRLPTIRELAGLLDPTCGAPAIDRRAFPDIAPNDEGKASYWSSTPAPDIPGMTYVVDFQNGDPDAHSSGIRLNVRLVREGR